MTFWDFLLKLSTDRLTSWLIVDLRRAFEKRDYSEVGTMAFMVAVSLPIDWGFWLFGRFVHAVLTLIQLPGRLLSKRGNPDARKTGAPSVNDDPSSW